MEVGEYTLVNAEKVERALNGSLQANNERTGGIGHGAYKDNGVWKKGDVALKEPEVKKLESALLSEYDKLGGLIRIGKDKVKTGSFFDFKAKTPKAKPDVILTFQINGKTVELKADEPVPAKVRAAQQLAEEEDAERKEAQKSY